MTQSTATKSLGLSLGDLIAPTSIEAFVRRYWAAKPLIVRRGQAEHFAELFNGDDFEFLMHSLTNPQGGWFSMVKDIARPPTDALLSQEGLLNLSHLYGAYGDGSSILLNQVQRRHKATGRLCRQLEMEFGRLGIALSRHIGANGYLSPPHSRGFAIHYDPHDVFILQLEGHKQWRIYGRQVPFPIDPPPAPVSAQDAGEPRQEFVLAAGDSIYIPRGYLHDASTTNSHSLHVTLSVETVTWRTYLSQIMAEDPRFRRDIPVGFADGAKLTTGGRKAIAEIAATLAGSHAANSALGRVASQLLTNLDPLPNVGFHTASKISAIRANTWLELAQGAFGRVEIDGEAAILHLPGSAFRAGREMAPAFRYLVQCRRVRACDLPVDTTSAEKLKFVRELVRGGHLVPPASNR